MAAHRSLYGFQAAVPMAGLLVVLVLHTEAGESPDPDVLPELRDPLSHQLPDSDIGRADVGLLEQDGLAVELLDLTADDLLDDGRRPSLFLGDAPVGRLPLRQHVGRDV